MEYVQPIRDIEKIEEVKSILRQKGTRDLLLFCLGINTSLRISDLLKFKVGDVRNKSHIELREQKTGKLKRFLLKGNLLALIEDHIKNKSDEEYLFLSRNGHNKPLTRVMAYTIINNACRQAGIQEKIGTHTLRKTFSYHFYQTHKDIAMLQYLLNHSNPSTCLRYIGITQDNIEESLLNFEL
jgi:integrase